MRFWLATASAGSILLAMVSCSSGDDAGSGPEVQVLGGSGAAGGGGAAKGGTGGAATVGGSSGGAGVSGASATAGASGKAGGGSGAAGKAGAGAAGAGAAGKAGAGGASAGSGGASGAPSCLGSTEKCNGGGCCDGLVCGKTTLGEVCCGNQGAPCKTANGEDCCGALECVGGKCTLPAPSCLGSMAKCNGGGCCSGLVCGKTSLGEVCCGNEGAPCVTADGADCCGALECVNGKCSSGQACLKATQPCNGGGCCAGLSCGTTSLGKVCCGNEGAPCATANGEDCCGALECMNGKCGGGSTGGGYCAPILGSCTEAAILAATPAAQLDIVKRALDWVHKAAPYSQNPQPKYGGYRTDCSGLVSMAWGLPPPGETTYSFAGGPWFDHTSVKLSSWKELAIGDATNFPGDPSQGTGHIRLFVGWLNGAHTSFCTIEEYDYGHPAEIRPHSVDYAYLPIRLHNFSPACGQ